MQTAKLAISFLLYFAVVCLWALSPVWMFALFTWLTMNAA